MLRLEDRWVWDWWLADDGSRFHVFYLQAPKALGDQHLRHRNATVGHAVSDDLRDWHILPDALRPGPAGTWDDIATWTGSTIFHAGTWHMFYTGTSTAEGGRVQRIGLATSPDLVAWTKHPRNPLFEADPRWYEIEDPGPGARPPGETPGSSPIQLAMASMRSSRPVRPKDKPMRVASSGTPGRRT